MEDHYTLTGTISCARVRPGHNCSVQFLIQKNNNDIIWHKLHSFPTKNQVKSDKYAQHITHNKKKNIQNHMHIYIYITAKQVRCFNDRVVTMVADKLGRQ